MKVPQSGVRVLIASDGVWDAFEKMLRVCRMARAWHIEVGGPPHKQIATTVHILQWYYVLEGW